MDQQEHTDNLLKEAMKHLVVIHPPKKESGYPLQSEEDDIHYEWLIQDALGG